MGRSHPRRRSFPASPAAAVCAALAGLALASGIYRDGFDGKQTAWVKGGANVPFSEDAHEITTASAHTFPSSEYLRLRVEPTPGNLNPFVYYRYATPPAPVTEELIAGLRVRGSRLGVQLLARLVLPRERNPANLNEPFTTLLRGEATTAGGPQWQRLELRNPLKLLKDEQQLLRTKLQRDVNVADAYIDQLLVNVHTGPGVMEVWLDDLEIGPVLDAAPNDRKVSAKTVSTGGAATRTVPALKPNLPAQAPVEFTRDQLRVGGKGFLFRGIRYTDTPADVLSEAGVNTLFFDGPPRPGVVEEAGRLGLRIVPLLNAGAGGPDALAAEAGRYQADEPVLFWNLGSDRPIEGLAGLELAVKAVRGADAGQHPLTADVRDGFWPHSGTLDLIGTYRWPLLTGMELPAYRDYLVQRRNLARPGTFFWTGVQTHLPDWYVSLVYPQHTQGGFAEPVGPQAEQIRLLAYVALAAGYRGLVYSSDRSLADDHQGRDRLLAVALLNQELQMLEPLLLSASESPQWIDTSDRRVKAAVLRCERGLLVIPLWLGDGAQLVPGQAAARQLSFTVPQVPTGTQPWEVSPGDVHSLPFKRVVGGTQVTLPEFGLSAAVVFTADMGRTGVEGWQVLSRRMARSAAEWSIDLAREEIRKVGIVQKQLEGLAPSIPDAAALLRDANERVAAAKTYWDGDNHRDAYKEAQRALRPLRILMRAQWEAAVKAMGPDAVAMSSPYAVSFYTLPQHWKFWDLIKQASAGSNAVPDGDFERDGSLGGGWQVEKSSLDGLELTAQLSGDGPQEGKQCLLLRAAMPKVASPNGPVRAEPPAALERTALRVHSPASQFPAGSLVRVSGWVKVPEPIKSSVEGAMLYDSAGGEPLAVRLTTATKGWRKFTLYRRVPPSGLIQVTLELRGVGTVCFDDVRVEPLLGG